MEPERGESSNWLIGGLIAGTALFLCVVVVGTLVVLASLIVVAPPPPQIDRVTIEADPPSLFVSVQADFYGKPVFEFAGQKVVGEEAFVNALGRESQKLKVCEGEVALSFFVQGMEKELSDTKLKELVKKAGCTWVNVGDADAIERTWGPPPDQRKLLLSKGEPIKARILVVGVRDGDYQFRLNGELVEGQKALAEKMRKSAADAAKKRGGPVLINPIVTWARELNDVAGDRGGLLTEFIESSVPEVSGPLGFRGSAGMKRRVGEKLLVLVVTMTGVEKDLMTYRLEDAASRGDKALTATLKDRFENWHKAQEPTAICAMHVTLTVDPKARTATEEQIANARKAIKAAGARVYEPKAQKPVSEPAP